MLIRKIEEKDNQKIAEVIRSCFADFNAPTAGTVFEDPTTDNLSELFKKEKSVLYVAQEDDEVFGCCGIYPTDSLPDGTVELVKFYVSSKARGKGVGRALFEISMEAAKQMGYKKVYIESLPEFSKAVSIYEKQGFKYLDQPLGNSAHPGCNLWMLKDIED